MSSAQSPLATELDLSSISEWIRDPHISRPGYGGTYHYGYRLDDDRRRHIFIRPETQKYEAPAQRVRASKQQVAEDPMIGHLIAASIERQAQLIRLREENEGRRGRVRRELTLRQRLEQRIAELEAEKERPEDFSDHSFAQIFRPMSRTRGTVEITGTRRGTPLLLDQDEDL